MMMADFYANNSSVIIGKIPVILRIHLSNGTYADKNATLTVKNPKSTIVDSARTHTVSLSMERTTFDGQLTLKNQEYNHVSYIEQTGISPFTVTDLGDGSYWVTAKYKSLLKAGSTYKVKVKVWTDFDAANYAGTPMTINIKVVK